MPEPLLEFLYSPFNLLQYFKDGVHRSKIENILVSDPDSKKASGSEITCFRVRKMLLIFAHFLPNQIPLIFLIILSVFAITQFKKAKLNTL